MTERPSVQLNDRLKAVSNWTTTYSVYIILHSVRTEQVTRESVSFIFSLYEQNSIEWSNHNQNKLNFCVIKKSFENYIQFYSIKLLLFFIKEGDFRFMFFERKKFNTIWRIVFSVKIEVNLKTKIYFSVNFYLCDKWLNKCVSFDIICKLS